MEHEAATDLIKRLQLERHPEGGWYREVYRSPEQLPAVSLPERFNGPRSHATSIYFLLTSESCSRLHRIAADEQWHFYTGSPLTIHVITPDGEYHPMLLGPDHTRGQCFQAVVTHDNWFGATVEEAGAFALVGCSVAPGFEFADFELACRSELLLQYPQHAGLISRLTRP